MNLMSSLFGSFQGKSMPDRPSACEDVSNKKSTSKTEKYKTEIQALTDYFGELKNGVCEIELSQLLQIIPKDRRRIDAYRGLISYLHEQYGVTLTIKSRKTK